MRLHTLWRGRRRGVSVAVVAMLALAIAVATVVFNLADGVLWREPDLPHARQIEVINTVNQHGYNEGTTLLQLRAWERAHIPGLALGAYENDTAVVRSGNYAGMSWIIGVTPGTMAMLGVPPSLGRSFAPQDQDVHSAPVALLSHSMFEDALGGDARLLGKAYVNAGREHCLAIGVMPEGFHVPGSVSGRARPEVWVPLWVQVEMEGWPFTPDTGTAGLARLAPGVSAGGVAAQLTAIARSQPGETPPIRSVALQPLLAAEASGVRTELLLLSAGGAVVLLLGFLNAACLLGAAAMQRREERAIRMSLGASAWRLRRDEAWTGALLGFAGGVCGVVLAALSARSVGNLAASYLASPQAAEPSVLVLAVMVAAATLLGAIAGGMAAGNSTASPRQGRVRLRLLAMGEIALSVAMVFAAALVTLSFVRMVNFPHNFSASNVVYATAEVNWNRAKSAAQLAAREAKMQALLAAMQQEPSLRDAALSNGEPLALDMYETVFAGWGAAGRRLDQHEAMFASAGLFAALRIPVLEGSLSRYRFGSDAVVLDQATALQLFGTQHAVGRRVTWGVGNHGEVVAVVATLRGAASRRWRPVPTFYTAAFPHLGAAWYLILTARAHGPAIRAEHALAQLASAAFPATQIDRLGTLASREGLAQPRFETWIALMFALLALAIGLAGVFAFMAHCVAQRRRELAIRLAVGDSPQGLFTRVVFDTAALGLVGAVAGLVAAWWVGGAIRSLLFEVAPTDWRILAAAGVGVVAAATLAGVLPALRAARTDPNQLLRDA